MYVGSAGGRKGCHYTVLTPSAFQIRDGINSWDYVTASTTYVLCYMYYAIAGWFAEFMQALCNVGTVTCYLLPVTCKAVFTWGPIFQLRLLSLGAVSVVCKQYIIQAQHEPAMSSSSHCTLQFCAGL